MKLPSPQVGDTIEVFQRPWTIVGYNVYGDCGKYYVAIDDSGIVKEFVRGIYGDWA